MFLDAAFETAICHYALPLSAQASGASTTWYSARTERFFKPPLHRTQLRERPGRLDYLSSNTARYKVEARETGSERGLIRRPPQRLHLGPEHCGLSVMVVKIG